MSDWMDLQLAHSLAPVPAPAALWERVDAALIPAAVARPRRFPTLRWAVPCAAAAAVVLLLVRATAIELRAHPTYASNDPVAVEHWLAHEAGIPVPLRPAPGVRITGARVERPGVATVGYVVDGRPETITISRAPGALPARPVLVASTSSRFDASCKLCHSL